MAGTSKKTRVVTVRLPVGVADIIERRIKKTPEYRTVGSYVRDLVIFNTTRPRARSGKLTMRWIGKKEVETIRTLSQQGLSSRRIAARMSERGIELTDRAIRTILRQLKKSNGDKLSAEGGADC